MPIYEYYCRRCKRSFETIVLSSKEKVKCPSCAGAQIKKQLSVFSSPGSQMEKGTSGGGCGGCSPQGCGCN